MVDRRKEPRFRVHDDAFAIDTREPRRLGKLIDISRSGVSFQYIAGPDNLGAGSELHIFSSTHALFLKRFPFETVSDAPMPKHHPASSLPMRRHSGRFPLLDAGQQKRLDEFITLHSVAAAGTSI